MWRLAAPLREFGACRRGYCSKPAAGVMRCIEYVRESPEQKKYRVVVGTRARPTISESEVLIKVFASGVNRPDIVQRDGLYPPPKGVTDIPGLEVYGRVERVGAACDSRWREGDMVAALVPGGGYAEFCTAHHGSLLPVPAGTLSSREAAALPETLFTVWFNLFHLGGLRAGDMVLVHGAAGGVGTMCIQLGKQLGLHVIGIVSSDAKAEAIKQLGAHAAINHTTQDYVAETLSLTGGKGVSAVLDVLAGDFADRNLQVLSRGGRLVIIGLMAGAKSTLGMHRIMLNQLTVTGSTLRPQPAKVKQLLRDELEAKVWNPFVLGGDLRAAVAGVYPLEQVEAAQAALESRTLVGKVVLDMGVSVV